MPRPRRFLLFFCVFLATFLISTASALTATVKGGYLRMRTSPSTSSVILNRYPSGTVLSVLDQEDDWVFVQASDGNRGYMLSSYLDIGTGTATTSVSSGTAYVTSSNGKSVNLRARASKNAVSIERYPVGTKVTVTGIHGSWRKVSVNGKSGYMMAQYLSSAKVSPPSSSSPSSKSGRVRSDNGKPVHMRSGSSKNSPVIGTYDVGTRLTILSKGRVWSYISISGQVGYMKTEYIR